MRTFFVLLLICPVCFSQLSQKDACQKFSSAVVRIDAGGESRGTGFLISKDGWILTAAHVVVDESKAALEAYSTIGVTLPDEAFKFATLASPLEPNMVARDYALLKRDGRSNLPYVELGEKPDVIAPGSDITIIGFPFSAIGFKDAAIKNQFCLAGTVAYSGTTNVLVSINTKKGPIYIQVNGQGAFGVADYLPRHWPRNWHYDESACRPH